MKAKFLKKALAVEMALILVLAGVPVKPFSQIFNMAAITAEAAEGQNNYTITWKNGTEYKDTGENTISQKTVATVGDKEFDSLKAAIDAAQGDETVVVYADVDEPDTNPGQDQTWGCYSKNIEIDLNGHTVTFGTFATNYSFTIKNGTLNCALNNISNYFATLTLDNAVLNTPEAEDEYSQGISWMADCVEIKNKSVMVLNGNAYFNGWYSEAFDFYIDETSSVIMNNVMLSASDEEIVIAEIGRYLPTGYSFAKPEDEYSYRIFNDKGEVVSDPVTLRHNDEYTSNLPDITIPSQVWTGSELTPEIIVMDGNTKLTEGTDYRVKAPLGAVQDAGDYNYIITGKGKYIGKTTATFTIKPKPISITGVTATERNYVYQDTSVEISAVTFEGAVLTKEIDYIVTGEMDDDKAGYNKKVTVTVILTNSNYTFGTNDDTTTTTVNIGKNDHSEVTASGAAKYGADGTVDLLSFIEASGSLGAVSVSDAYNILYGTPTIEDDGKKLKFKCADNSGNVGKTAIVTIPVTGAANYKNYNIVVTLAVEDKIVPTLAVSDFTKTYDGSPVTIGELTKTAKDGNSDIDGTWTFEGTPELKNVSDSGVITVKFTPTDTTNYGSATTTFTLTINRKAVTVKADNKSMVVGTTPEPGLTATVSGTVGSDTVNYTVTREAGTAVGTYTITPSGNAEQGNYAVSYETGVFTITEDVPVVKKAPKAITGLVCNGKAQVLVEPGEAENGTMYYAVTTMNTAPEDNLYTTMNYAATNAGTYFVWYKAVGDKASTGTKPACVEVTIQPIDKTDLNEAIADAKTYYNSIKDETIYSEVASALKTAIDSAKLTAADDNADETAVNSSKAAILQAKADAEAGKKEVDDVIAADKVADAISKLPAGDQVAVSDKAAIETAREAYKDLTEDQKKKVSGDVLKKLTDAENALEEAARMSAENETAKRASELEAAKKEAQAAMNEQVTVIQKGSKFTVKWKKSTSADGYDVYARYSGKKAGGPAKTIAKNTTTKTTITKINGRKIDQKKIILVYVVPYKIIDGKKVALGESTAAYLAGAKNTKFSNVKKLTLNQSRYTVTVGNTSKIKAKVTLVDKNKKHLPKKYAARFRYKSSDESIATVDGNGKIKGIRQGTCTIYVYSVNGLAKKATVLVK